MQYLLLRMDIFLELPILNPCMKTTSFWTQLRPETDKDSSWLKAPFSCRCYQKVCKYLLLPVIRKNYSKLWILFCETYNRVWGYFFCGIHPCVNQKSCCIIFIRRQRGRSVCWVEICKFCCLKYNSFLKKKLCNVNDETVLSDLKGNWNWKWMMWTKIIQDISDLEVSMCFSG